MDVQKEYDWLIVAFIHEILGQTSRNEAFIRQIRDADHGDNNLVFLVRDAIVGTGNSDDGPVPSFVLTLSKLVRTDTGEWIFQEVTGLPIHNSDRHCWMTAFEYIFARSRARRRMLVTLSHGAGLGINRDIGTIMRPPVNGLSSQENEAPANPCQHLEILWSYELAGALDLYLSEARIDILLMVNCDMQLFDTGYMLREKVRWLIAPEGAIASPGYDYRSLFFLLHYFPFLPEERIVKTIVDDYRRLSEAGKDRYTSLFANRLTSYASTAALLNEFVSLLIGVTDVYIQRLKAVRANILYVSLVDNDLSYNSLDLIDLGLWMKGVAGAIPEIPRLAALNGAMEEARKEIVKEQCIGKAYTDSDLVYAQKFGYSGISIYFPMNKEMIPSHPVMWCAYFGTGIPNPFKIHTNWDLFLVKYFMALSRSIRMEPIN